MTRLLAILVAAIAAMPAFAHHPTGGEAPQSVWHGLLSGLAHPVIGLDHLAFIVLVGLAAAGSARLFAGPAMFIAATMIGTLVHLGGVVLPLSWAVIGVATLVLAALLIVGRQVTGPLALAGFAFAGLFHGWDYGEAVIGATTMPIMAYLVGFGVIQFGVAVGIALAARRLSADTPTWMHPRTAAAVCAGVGLAFFAIEAESVAAEIVAPASEAVQDPAHGDEAEDHDHHHNNDHGDDQGHQHDHD